MVRDDELARVPLFSSLSPSERQTIREACFVRDYPSGAIIVRQDEGGLGLYILLSGSAQVTRHAEDGDEQLIALLGPGSVFGEMALLDALPRSATVTALDPVHALVLTILDFRAALLESPDIAIKLLSVLSQRLRRIERDPAR
ncbi:MAG TPA: cyclic nucleotide-binding domain-containing protein [Ktedonobacterales bacterium]